LKKRNERENREKPAAARPKTRISAYGGSRTICVNADCTLRKKAGGCSGFEGCPGFRSAG
jgi:hypothetical protein